MPRPLGWRKDAPIVAEVIAESKRLGYCVAGKHSECPKNLDSKQCACKCHKGVSK